MKAWIEVGDDLENEVMDIFLCYELEKDGVFRAWLRGFDDVEWKEARAFAKLFAEKFGLEVLQGDELTIYGGADED